MIRKFCDFVADNINGNESFPTSFSDQNTSNELE